MGMGGLAIANPDAYTISRINPANLSRIQTTRISLQYYYESNKYHDKNDWASSSYSNFDGFNFVVPIGKGIGFGTSLLPLTRVDYHLSFNDSLSGEEYIKSIEGSGGMNSFSLSLYLSLRSNFSIGINGHYIFGRIQEESTIDYNGIDFISTQDMYATHHRGSSLTLGILYQPLSSLILGGIYTSKTKLDTETNKYTLTDTKSHSGNLLYPGSWGVGVTYILNNFIQFGMEYNQKNWTSLSINDIPVSGTKKTDRFVLGGEILPNRDPFAPYYKRMSYRFGLSYQPYLSTDLEGNDIKEISATLGFGFPFLMNKSQIDIALCFGKRGSIKTNNLSENLFRVSVTLTGGEKWFVRRY
jgi:hypothetical protein